MARRYNRKKAAKKEPGDKTSDAYTTPIDFGHIADQCKERPSISAFPTMNQRKFTEAVNEAPYEHLIDCHYVGCSDRTRHTLERLIGCITSAGRPAEDAIRCWNYHVPDVQRVPLDAFQVSKNSHTDSGPPHIKPDAPHEPHRTEPVPVSQDVLDRPVPQCPPPTRAPDVESIPYPVNTREYVDDLDIGLLEILKIELKDFPGVSIDTAYDAIHPFVHGDASQITRIRDLLTECKTFLEDNPVPVPEPLSDKTGSEYKAVVPDAVPVPVLDGMQSYEQYAEDYSNARGAHHIRNIAAGKYRGKSEWYGQHLSGHRRPARLYCGHYQRRGHIHGDTRFSNDPRIWCHERDCTTCFADAIRQFAIRSCDVLWSFMKACHSDAFLHKESGPLHHYVYSLNADDRETVKDGRGRATVRRQVIRDLVNIGRICKRCNRDALSCICNRLYHADGKCKVCNRKSATCKCVNSTRHTGGLHGGGLVYHACRFDNDCPRFGPHFHVVCMGYVDVKGWRRIHRKEIKAGSMCSTPEAEFEKNTGTVIKRVKRRGFKPGEERFMDIETKSKLGGLAYYLGTHNTKAKGEHGIVYYGTAANNKFGVKKMKCHDPTSVSKFEEWFNKRLRVLDYGGNRYDLTHARVQRVNINDSENESRYDWKFGIVEVLGRGKANLGDELLGYLQSQIKSHAYTTKSVKSEYRDPFSDYFAEMALKAKEAGEEVDGVVTVPANAKSKGVQTTPDTPYQPASRSIIMELTYSRQIPSSKTHKEKQHVVYCILDIDPSLVGLCPACFEPMEVLIPLSGVYPRPPDATGVKVKLDMDGEKWSIWDRSLHRGKGMPFFRKNGIMQEWGFGLLTQHPFERDLTPGLSAQVASDYVMSYARLYATYDNTTFIELYEAHLKEHQWEPDVWQWKKIRSKAIEASIANALGYLQKFNVPVCEPTYYARKYVEGGVVEAVEPMRWVLNYVSSVWQWLGVNVKPSKVENLVPIDPPPFRPEYGEIFTAVSMYYRGGTRTPRTPVEQSISATDSEPPGTGDRGMERQQNVGVGTAGCDGTCSDPECGSYRDEELGKFLNDLEGKNGQAAKDRADYRVWEHGGGRREPR